MSAIFIDIARYLINRHGNSLTVLVYNLSWFGKSRTMGAKMRDVTKKLLIKSGIYYSLNYIRQIPAIVTWLNMGCSKPAPHAVKMSMVRAYLRRYKLKYFVETGTYRGDTLEYIARDGVACTSIELSEKLFLEAKERFRSYANTTLLQGDSGLVIPQILQRLNEPALFWLDGHYSGDITARAEDDSPINTELDAIHKHAITQHVILIDDAHCFNGSNGYPHLDELLHEIRLRGIYHAAVSADIIRLTPLN